MEQPRFAPESIPAQTPGLNDIFLHNEFNMDSNSRDFGDNNSPKFVIGPIFDNVLGVKLISAQIPFSYYVFNSTNNTFTLTATSGGPYTFVIPVGNYTAATLATALAAELNAIDPAGAYTVTYSATTGKFTFTSLTPGYSFTFTFTELPASQTNEGPGATNPRLWIGFPAGDTSSTTGTIVAPFVANISGPGYLLLIASLGARISRSVRVNGFNSEDPPLLAKIPVNVNPGGLILFEDPTENYAFDMADGYLQEIEFSLQFGDSNLPVDLNGQPWSLVLQVLTKRDTSLSKYLPVSGAKGVPTITGRSKRIRIGP